MEHTKYSHQSILKIALGIVFVVWLMMCAPTGWIYNLWAGTGTGQGLMLVVGSAIAGKIRQAVRRKAQENVTP